MSVPSTEELRSYVRAELAGFDPDQLHPGVGFHIRTSSEIEAAYYAEFRRQGKEKTVEELKEVKPCNG